MSWWPAELPRGSSNRQKRYCLVAEDNSTSISDEVHLLCTGLISFTACITHCYRIKLRVTAYSRHHSDLANRLTWYTVGWMECKLQSVAAQERECVLMLDEMAVRKCLEYDKGLRSVVGNITEGICKNSSDSTVTLASHALVFTIRG